MSIRLALERAACALLLTLPTAECPAQDAPPIPREFSAIEPVRSRMLLGQLGARRAMWTVGDEGRVESNLGVFRQIEDGGPWDFISVEVGQDAETPLIPETDDAESMSRIGSRIVIMGSHFGSKAGPVESARAFLASIDEDVVFFMGGRVVIPGIEVSPNTLRIWTAVNDALATSGLDLISAGSGEESRLVAPRLAEAKATGWPAASARAINVEGFVVLPEGEALLGLRYPCTADGHPILVRFPSGEALLDSSASLRADAVWTVPDAGSKERPAGIRALAWRDGTLHIVVGNLDGDPEKSVILADHPEGALAECSRLETNLPRGASTTLSANAHLPLAGAMNIEGIALDEAGHIWGIADSKDATLPEMLAK